MEPVFRVSTRSRKLRRVFHAGTKRRARLRLIGERLGEQLTPFVAAAGGNLLIEDLRANTRKRAPVAAARQLGMYLAHTLFSLSYSRTARIFGRDRTTVRHACARIETRRDEAEMQELLLRLEPAVQGWTEAFAVQAARTEEVR